MKNRLTGALVFLLAMAAVAAMAYYYMTRHHASRTIPALQPLMPTIGEIQVLNGCGELGAAESIKAFLQERGFNVIESGNAESFRYDQTVVASRKEEMRIARQVAAVLGTSNVISLVNESKLFDVTVFVGNDYKKLMRGNKTEMR